jgi:hypothetical protein
MATSPDERKKLAEDLRGFIERMGDFEESDDSLVGVLVQRLYEREEAFNAPPPAPGTLERFFPRGPTDEQMIEAVKGALPTLLRAWLALQAHQHLEEALDQLGTSVEASVADPPAPLVTWARPGTDERTGNIRQLTYMSDCGRFVIMGTFPVSAPETATWAMSYTLDGHNYRLPGISFAELQEDAEDITRQTIEDKQWLERAGVPPA